MNRKGVYLLWKDTLGDVFAVYSECVFYKLKMEIVTDFVYECQLDARPRGYTLLKLRHHVQRCLVSHWMQV